MKDVEEEISQMAYDNVMKRLNQRQSRTESQMGGNLLEDLLLEKSLNLDKFKEDRGTTEEREMLDKLSDRVLTQGKQFKKSKLSAHDLDGLNETAIEDKISELMDLALDADKTD